MSKEEIKNILNHIRNYNGKGSFTDEDIDILENYITTLEQKNIEEKSKSIEFVKESIMRTLEYLKDNYL